MPHTTLIDTATLAGHLDGDWVVVDCRYDLKNEAWGREQYEAAHVPRAVYASLSHDLASAPSGRNGRHPLPSADQMAATFGRLGIGTGVQVVAYDQDVGTYASRLWWMLRYLGHDAVAVLDGGWAKWTREGRPTRSGAEIGSGAAQRPAAIFVPAVREGMRRNVADVEASLRDPAVVLVDARAAERFEGRVEPIDRVPGHIPGAINRPYLNNTDAGTMRPPDALREAFTRTLADHPPESVVMYCGSGVTACHNLLAMEIAGMPGASLYPGSWSEWSSDPRRPVGTGARPDKSDPEQ